MVLKDGDLGRGEGEEEEESSVIEVMETDLADRHTPSTESQTSWTEEEQSERTVVIFVDPIADSKNKS